MCVRLSQSFTSSSVDTEGGVCRVCSAAQLATVMDVASVAMESKGGMDLSFEQFSIWILLSDVAVLLVRASTVRRAGRSRRRISPPNWNDEKPEKLSRSALLVSTKPLQLPVAAGTTSKSTKKKDKDKKPTKQ